MEATIEVDGLRKRFGATVALDGMTFTVSPGHVTGFVGPNGAGKSTTMRVILGLDAPDTGTALVGGRPYAQWDRPLTQVGSLLDASALQPSRRARGHLLWLAHSQGLPAGPGGRGPPPGRAGHGGPAAGGRVLARHAAAAGHRRRAARRSPGPDVRRAVQRHGPGGHRVDARLPARPRRPGPGRADLQPPDERTGGHRRPPGHRRPGPGHRGYPHGRAAGRRIR